jgi:hypothetical protein
MRRCKICGKPLSLVPGLVCNEHKAVDRLWGMVVRGIRTDFPEIALSVTHAEMQISPRWRSERRWQAELCSILAWKGVRLDG